MARRESKLTTLDLLAGARVEACRKLPYLAKGLWRLTFIECDKVPTFAVDSKWRVYCNPEFTRACMKEGSLAGGVVHEGLHRILKHEKRAKCIHAEDHEHANICQDCEINERIDEARSAKGDTLRLPTCGVHARDYGWPESLSWEEYYRLPRAEQKKDKPNPCSGGSGTTGKRQPWELGDEAPGGVSEAEGEIIRAQVAQAVKEHADGRGRGTVPAGILRWAEDYGAPPPVPWRELVAAQVRYQIEAKRGPSPSYARPSRRLWDSMSLPVHRLPTATVCIVGDTSGSMGERDIGKIIASVLDAVEVLGKVTAIGCDAEAYEPVEVRHVDDLREALRGGGGTDMCVGLAKAAESRPDAIVCVTDGITPWPAEAPEGIPVVVVLTRAESDYCAPPAWAQVIEAADET
jgi:predicted metal-dependent peptidase